MHNVRCANSRVIHCECSCQGALHGVKGSESRPGKVKEDEIEVKNLFCPNCGNIFQSAENIVIKINHAVIRCPYCARESKL